MRFSIIIPVAKLNFYLEESIPKLLELDFPKEEYDRIEKAEKFDTEGNRVFATLKEEFYQLMGW